MGYFRGGAECDNDLDDFWSDWRSNHDVKNGTACCASGINVDGLDVRSTGKADIKSGRPGQPPASAADGCFSGGASGPAGHVPAAGATSAKCEADGDRHSGKHSPRQPDKGREQHMGSNAGPDRPRGAPV